MRSMHLYAVAAATCLMLLPACGDSDTPGGTSPDATTSPEGDSSAGGSDAEGSDQAPEPDEGGPDEGTPEPDEGTPEPDEGAPPEDTGPDAPVIDPNFDCEAQCEAHVDQVVNCLGAFGLSNSKHVQAPRSIAVELADVSAETLGQLRERLPEGAELHVAPRYRIVAVDAVSPTVARARLVDFDLIVRERLATLDTEGRRVVATDDLIVRFDGTAADPVGTMKALGVEVVRPLSHGAQGFLARAADGDAPAAADRLAALPGVVYAQVDWLRTYETREPDEFLDRQWHLHNTGQDGAIPGVDVQAFDAWTFTLGDPLTVIAVLDDGVDIEHPDFAGAVVPGFAVPADFGQALQTGCCGHGTSVAGVAAAQGDNAIGVSGACPTCSVMPAWNNIQLEADSKIAEAFTWIADHGASVVNCSWGPADGNPALLDEAPADGLAGPLGQVVSEALDYAETDGRGGLGMVVVWAAGNGNESIESDGFVTHPSTVAVAALDDQGVKTSYSDFGPQIDVAAPSDGGVTPGIVSVATTGIAGGFFGGTLTGAGGEPYTESFGGTSSAAPLVAGIAGLVLSVNPELTALEVREILRTTADKVDRLNGLYDPSGHSPYYGYGRVNAYAAVLAAVGGECAEEELCNGVDDTCDGTVDEGCEVLEACAPCAFDAACGEGNVCDLTPGDVGGRCLTLCGEGGACPEGHTCQAELCVPDDGRCDECAEEELCNGVDDNCDGSVDEGGVCPQAGAFEGCYYDGECAEGQLCLGGSCQTPCGTDEDCETGTCQAATDLYGNGAEGFNICNGFGGGGDPNAICLQFVCDGQNVEAQAGFFDCLDTAGEDCGAVFNCVLPLIGF